MMTAIPFVNPTTTGRGMNLTAEPRPVAPTTIKMTPAINVHMKSPSMPYLATIPNTTTTNAPVGPPICVEDPPNAEITKPAMIAQYSPAWGGTAEAMANAIASGNATSPTVTPARASVANFLRLYPLSKRIDLGSHSFICRSQHSSLWRLHRQRQSENCNICNVKEKSDSTAPTCAKF